VSDHSDGGEDLKLDAVPNTSGALCNEVQISVHYSPQEIKAAK
jgi:hypothetical protein